MSTEYLELASWRRAVAALYAAVRDCGDPADGHALWRAGRDDLFRSHPQSPLPSDDPSCRYNPRWECPLAPDGNRIVATVRAGERL
jgi:hypothetical protein